MWIKDKFFERSVSFEEKVKIRSIDWSDYNLSCFLSDNRTKISKASIKIHKKLKKDYNIEVFPALKVTKTKGYPESANFSMIKKGGGEILFFNSSIKISRKGTELDIDDCNTEVFIK